MPGLSQWAVRKPLVALISYFVALIAVVGIGISFGGSLNDSFDLPDTESTTATDLLATIGNAELNASSSGATAQIIWSPATGSAVESAASALITPVLEEIAALPAVECVTNPFDLAAPYGDACPAANGDMATLMSQSSEQELEQLEPALQASAIANSPISADGTVAYSTVTFTGGTGGDVPTADVVSFLDLVKSVNSQTIAVGASGDILGSVQTVPSSELFGILVAIVILLIAFGSIIAAGMPIVVAVIGLAAGQMLVLVVALFMDVATFAPTLAAMIGLGVGIDYALFVLNRYRQAILVGHEPKRAALEAVNTAGRAVLFAGATVIFALCGLFILRIGFFNGLALAAIVTVLMVMIAALWLLPATLSLLGTKALGLRLPWGTKPGEGHAEGKQWSRYGRFLQKRPWFFAIVSVGIVAILAIPVFSMRLGFADASGNAQGTPTRIAYDLTSEGFGPGTSGPFIVAVELSQPNDLEQYAAAITAIESTPGVAATNPSTAIIPLLQASGGGLSPDGLVGAVFVVPATGPQEAATADLLTELRDVTGPEFNAATGGSLYVGGALAVTSDFTQVLVNALPLFLLIVVSLGFLALMVLFRSVVVPLTAALTSLLSFAAATGITVAVFQWGWFSDILGVSGTGPIFPFLPIMVFAILFGLSMDYQVFLVSRMREEWDHTGDNAAAVRRGLAGSGKVVAIAAAIMASVFLAFVPTPDNTIKLFGVALGSAVLIDAFLIRLIAVPSIMSIIGKGNWWLPGWLDRILPTVHIEPGEDEVFDEDSEMSKPTPVG